MARRRRSAIAPSDRAETAAALYRARATVSHAEHIEGYGVEFFRLLCEQDLEGVVAKAKHGAYGEKWFKIRNPKYSQYEGRRELFESQRQAAAAKQASI